MLRASTNHPGMIEILGNKGIIDYVKLCVDRSRPGVIYYNVHNSELEKIGKWEPEFRQSYNNKDVEKEARELLQEDILSKYKISANQ